MSSLAFVVIAPAAQIAAGLFTDKLTTESITLKVKRRVEAYDGEREVWMNEWFIPTMKKIQIHCVSWEDTIDRIKQIDSIVGSEFEGFYASCVRYNQPRST